MAGGGLLIARWYSTVQSNEHNDNKELPETVVVTVNIPVLGLHDASIYIYIYIYIDSYVDSALGSCI